MAFQVIFSTHQVPAGTISSFNAGENQVAICVTSVVLTATVVGSLAGHVVEWEQLSGSPVIWTTPLDQLTVQFNMLDTPDRLFRFWIDRYTPFAMFDDVWVLGTPISEAHTLLSGMPPTVVGVDCRTVQCNEFGVVASTPLSPHNGVSSCGGDTNYQLIWNNPLCDNDNIIAYIVESNDGTTGWVQHAILTDKSQRYLSVPTGMWYRIVTLFDDSIALPSIITSTISCNKSTNPAGAGVYAWDSLSINLGAGGAIVSSYAVATRSLVIKDDTELISVSNVELLPAGVSDTLADTFDVITRSLTIKDDPELISVSNIELMPGIISIPLYDVLVLDGSVIGG